MNLFRSKEDALKWSGFVAGTEAGVLSLAQAAAVMSTPRHSARLNGSYVSSSPDFTPRFVEKLMEVTGGSQYWDPR